MNQRSLAHYPGGFPEFAQALGGPRAYPAKMGIPMFSPAEWPAGTKKDLANVQRVHFAVLDYDDVPEEDLVQLLARVQAPYVFCSSWSHGDPYKTQRAQERAKTPMDRFLAAWGTTTALVRGRLIMPFTRPVLPAEWRAVWRQIASRFQFGRAVIDRSCGDASHCYYVPAHPQPPPLPPIYIDESRRPAAPLNVDEMIASAPPEDPAWAKIATTYRNIKGPEPAQYDLTRLELRALAKTWARNKTRGRQEIVEALRAICEGEAFASAGGRDTMLYRVCATLAEKHPYASPESVGKLLAPSLKLMGMDGPSLEDALEKMARKKREERKKVEVDRDSRIAAYFKNKRDTPYTQTELESFEEQLDASLKRRWIIQKGKSFYLFGGIPQADLVCTEGNYFGPFTLDDVANAARSILAPAVSCGVTFDTTTAKTQRAKTSAELVREYGEVATAVVADLTAEHSYFDASTSQFVEAPCPLRELVPREHRDIDRWLRLFAGDSYPRLLEWIAGLTLLDIPSSALYLEGPPNTGKTLLASGLARLWTKDGPSNFEEALNANFNEGLLKSPLVFGDEVAPKDFRGRVRTGEIREFIQARQRPLKRKFLPAATLRGCIRLILAANNRELLSSNEHMTTNDIAALVERFFYIHTDGAAAAYLSDMRERSGSVIEAWVGQDHIAEHALYLRDTIAVSRHTRLIASSTESMLARSLTTSTGIRSAVCNWLVSYLLDPTKLTAHEARELVRVHEGTLVVNARVFADHWSLYPTSTQAPTPSRVASALSGLAPRGKDRVHLSNRRGARTWYRVIDTVNLATWAEDTGFATEEGICAAIAGLEALTRREAN